MTGQFQFFYHIDSAIELTRGDEIRVEDRVYKVFYGGAAVLGWFAMRIE